MKRHRLLVVLALFPFAWGCSSNTTPDGSATGRREVKLKASTTEATTSTTNQGNASNCQSGSVVAMPPSPEPSGTPIVLTAEFGCPDTQYRFLGKPIGNESCGHGDGCGPWVELRGWGGPTFTYDTTGLAQGRYLLRAQGSEGGTHTLTYELTEPCPPGYHSEGFDVCVDIDECLTGNGACDPLVVCTNLPGTRSCGECPSGYTGTGDTACMVPFTASELVGRPTDHSITINVMAGQLPGTEGEYQALEVYVEHGTAPDDYTGSTQPAVFSDGLIESVVDGLAPNTRYYYRMRYRPSGSTAPFLAGSEHTFHTQRAAGSTFTFAVKSDSHQGYTLNQFWDEELYRITMANIAADQADFLLDLGDTVSTDDATETQATVFQKYLAQRTSHGIVGHSLPVFLAMGNHENEEGWNLDDFGADRQISLPVLGTNGRKRFFLNPIPGGIYSGNIDDSVPEIDGDHLLEDYYAFTWGDALFVVLDPFWYTMKKPYAGGMGGEKTDETVVGNRWDWTLGDQQYQWLKQTLESSTAKFKFVFAHHATGGLDDYIRGGALGAAYCEWGGYDTDGVRYVFESHRPGWEMPIHQLFVHTKVTAFFHGHDHVFAQEVLDGVVYQEVPFSASPAYNTGFADNTTYYAGAESGLINDSGHLRVTVTPVDVTVDYVRAFLAGDGTNAQVSYTYPIVPCEARGDSDGDQVPDCSDECPSDPNKTAPGQCGCGRSDSNDSDGDGVADCRDGCPTDPLKTAPGVCGCGLPESEPCSFMVVRVGTGSSRLNLASTATFVEERRLGDGSLVGDPIVLPTSSSGDQRPLTLSGSAPVEGTLKRSVDGRFVMLAGYAVGPGRLNVAYTETSVVNRVVGRIAADHTVDTTTVFTAAFSGTGSTTGGLANDRAVASYDGGSFWVAGAGANTNTGGLWYIPFGTTLATQITGQSENPPGNVRSCGIFGDQLYGATNVAPFFGVFAVGSGMPDEQATATLLPGFPTSGSSSPVDFAVLDRDASIDGMDTIYVADSRALGSPPGAAGGIQKWTFDGATWTRAYTLVNGLTTGVNHVLAIAAPAGVVLLAETNETRNSIVRVFDTGSSSPATPIATAAANTAFRGLALSPVP